MGFQTSRFGCRSSATELAERPGRPSWLPDTTGAGQTTSLGSGPPEAVVSHLMIRAWVMVMSQDVVDAPDPWFGAFFVWWALLHSYAAPEGDSPSGCDRHQ